MEAIGYHLMFRLIDDRVLAPSQGRRRVLARTTYRLGEKRGLIVFGVADSHLHVGLRCSRRAAGQFAHDLCCALHFAIEPKQHFNPTRFRTIENQRHLETVVGYAFRQKRHHGILVDALRDGTSLPELLGLRVLARRSVTTVRELLPRLRRRDLMEYLGPGALEPVAELDLSLDPLEDVLDAAAGALGLASLVGGDRRTRLGRATLLQVPSSKDLESGVRHALALTASTTTRLRRMVVPTSLARAVRLQLGLRRWLREHGRRDEDSLG